MRDSAEEDAQRYRERINRLDTTDINAFFAGFGQIRQEIQAEIAACEEKQHYRNQRLPEIKTRIADLKSQIQDAKQEITDSVAEFAKEAAALEAQIAEKFPEVAESLRRAQEANEELKRLKWQRVMSLKVEEAVLLLETRSFAKFRAVFDELSDMPADESKFLPGLLPTFKSEFTSACSIFLSKLRESLYEEFAAIKFPFESATDYNSIQRELETVQELLRGLHAVLLASGEGEERQTVLQIVLDEFAKRFNFHFYGERRTNDPAKPEWFFAQLSAWLSTNFVFFRDYLQPLVLEVGDDGSSTVAEEFIEFLVLLAAEKVRNMLGQESFIEDSQRLSHLIDETVVFEKELTEVYVYPEEAPHVVSEFCREDVLRHWLAIERDTTSAGLDALFADDTAFECRFSEVADLDEEKVPNFAEGFVLLMQAMAERYRTIPDERIQCQFLKLQLLAIDDFRARVLSRGSLVEGPFAQPFPQLLNALAYVAKILDSWSGSLEFIRLQSFQHTSSSQRLPIRCASGSENNQPRGVFDDASGLYRQAWRQWAQRMAAHFGDDMSFRLGAYAGLPWTSSNGRALDEITPEFVTLIGKITDVLGLVKDNISLATVDTVFQLLNDALWHAIDEIVVARINFSQSGAAHMFFDMTAGLIPALEAIFKWPRLSSAAASGSLINAKCSEVLNVLKLLSLPAQVLERLVKEIQLIPEQMVDERLVQFEITDLPKEKVLDVLRQRYDLVLR